MAHALLGGVGFLICRERNCGSPPDLVRFRALERCKSFVFKDYSSKYFVFNNIFGKIWLGL